MSRVLVVEDEAHLAKGLRFNLEAEGHAVEVCGDGETAIERLLHDHQPFDAVVLDVMLPGKDGFAVATALRKAKNYVPVLMLTARGRPEDALGDGVLEALGRGLFNHPTRRSVAALAVVPDRSWRRPQRIAPVCREPRPELARADGAGDVAVHVR